MGPLELEPEGFRARLRGRDLDLARHEILLLHALMRHPAHIFSRDRLQREMYGDDLAVTERTVDAAVSRLRAKARAIDEGLPLIDSVYGIGYKLAAGLSEAGS
jgi:DNA-binding response OmpR family regulator